MKKESKILLTLALTAIVPFICLVALKFHHAHRLSPTDSGFGGVEAMNRIGFLFMGSSHTRAGYDMEIIERETTEPSFALAYSGFNPHLLWPAFHDIIERRGDTIDTFVIESYCYASLQAPGLYDKRVVLDAPPSLKKDYIDLFRKDFHWLKPADYYDLIVSYGNDYLATQPVSSRAINMLSYRGSYRGRHMAGLSEKAFSEVVVPEAILNTDGEPDRFQTDALKDLMEFADESALDVVFIETPMPGPIERHELVIRAKRQLKELFETGGFEYLDGAIGFPIDDPAMFNDDNHLSTAGREAFSIRVGEFLRARKS